MEAQGASFLERVRAGFLAIAQNNPLRFRVLDAALPPEALHAAILAQVRDRLTAR
jgi:dTMP kinase